MTVRALLVHKFGKKVEIGEIPEPQVGPSSVKVKVRFSSLNPVDVETITSSNPFASFKTPFVPGVDAAGEVLEVGAKVTGIKTGDHVAIYAGVPNAGMMAEVVVVPEKACAIVPNSVSLEQAAALALAGVAGLNCLEALNVSAGDKILVHGAAGAVATCAMQIAISRGIEVIAHVNSRSAEAMKSLGAREVIAYDKEDFVDLLKNRPVDGVVDVVGGRTLKKSFKVVKEKGVVASVSTIPGPTALKNAEFKVPAVVKPILSFAAWMSQPKGSKTLVPVVSGADGSVLQKVINVAAEGKLKMPIARSVTLDQVFTEVKTAKATRLKGKISVVVSTD